MPAALHRYVSPRDLLNSHRMLWECEPRDITELLSAGLIVRNISLRITARHVVSLCIVRTPVSPQIKDLDMCFTFSIFLWFIFPGSV